MSFTFRSVRLVHKPTTAALRLASLRSQLPQSPIISSYREMSSLPSHMKAVVIDKTGGTEVLRYAEDHPLPELKDDQVLVKNKYGGINFIDTYFRSGLYPLAKFPHILGQEGVGTVVATQGSNLYGLKEGDEVVWMTGGAYAEYSAVPVDRVMKLPAGIPDKEVLGSFLMGMTALALIKESYEVKKGDTILVQAAAGGVGLLLCQLLRDIGATVIGTASTKEKCDAAAAHGATHMINYKENTDWVSKVKEIAPEGVDCVYDSVGATTWEGSLEAVKRKGTVVFFGNASGPVPAFSPQKLAPKSSKITRAVLFNYIFTREEFEFYANLLFKNLKDSGLKVNIYKIYDLKDAKQAQDDLQGRLTSGKLLLKTS